MSASDITLGELQTEFQERGFHYLSTTRQNYYLDAAYRIDICEGEDWPFLEATTSGTAPVTISDLRDLESAINSTQDQKLRPLDRRDLTTNYDTDLTTTGTPQFYYLTEGSIVNVYPANTTDTISVRYWKVPTILADSTDTPDLPSRFRTLIVDAAVARAYEDDDEFDASKAAWAQFQVRMTTMKESLLVQQHDEPDDVIQVYAPDSDL